MQHILEGIGGPVHGPAVQPAVVRDQEVSLEPGQDGAGTDRRAEGDGQLCRKKDGQERNDHKRGEAEDGQPADQVSQGEPEFLRGGKIKIHRSEDEQRKHQGKTREQVVDRYAALFQNGDLLSGCLRNKCILFIPDCQCFRKAGGGRNSLSSCRFYDIIF